ncbi:M23 family metallopeptidase [Streptomyces liangshanensis]|uniref:M23 family metallopeptidase n=1 Tax=Streptomyces liangshanensis TaxID=2717324 RepID=A0A6G9H0K1_9ACTN|nr:M23 family metallopeptidase [Streptomyces liangshanensis]QIQ04004.1 M23 family metallopeptidase [Streptomyces liangshanensis]
MASNKPALDAPFETETFEPPTFGGEADRTWGEWNPTEESVLPPVRGRHRVAKQRGLARSSTVLGVGVLAAVGAGGIATAQDKPAVSISLPDAITDNLPAAKSLPGVGSLGTEEAKPSALATDPLTTAGMTTADFQQGATDAGEALRARILQQAEAQQAEADATTKLAAQTAAAEKAAADAKKQQSEAEKKIQEAKEKAEAEAKAKAAAKAEKERLAKLAQSYTLPVVSYTITSTFGQAGSMWSSGYHTGLDFAAPTGTPIKAVHSGTVKSAGWSGSYGYRTVLELDDGTELWFCHQSSMTVTAGQKVATGEVIGRVGATGNVTGPHLHLEVHTPGGTGIDPMAWLQGKGLNP